MSVRSLCDGECTVWIRSETRGSKRETIESWTVLARDVACTYQERSSVLASRMGGDRPAIDGRVYIADTSLDLRGRNVVIEITAGPAYPETGLLINEGTPYAPRGNHWQLNVREWDGVLS